HAVSPADYQIAKTLQMKYLPISSEQQAGVGLLHPDRSAVPFLGLVGWQGRWANLMIAVDAQERGFHLCQKLLHLGIPPVQEIIGPHIPQKDEGVLLGQLVPVTELYDLTRVPVDIARVVDHGLSHLSPSIIPTLEAHILDFSKTYSLSQKHIHFYRQKSTGSQST